MIGKLKEAIDIANEFRNQVKSRHFPEKIQARRQHFGKKRIGKPFRTVIWIYYYLLNKIKLDYLDLDKFLDTKIPGFVTNNINIWFFTIIHRLTQENEFPKL